MNKLVIKALDFDTDHQLLLFDEGEEGQVAGCADEEASYKVFLRLPTRLEAENDKLVFQKTDDFIKAEVRQQIKGILEENKKNSLNMWSTGILDSPMMSALRNIGRPAEEAEKAPEQDDGEDYFVPFTFLQKADFSYMNREKNTISFVRQDEPFAQERDSSFFTLQDDSAAEGGFDASEAVDMNAAHITDMIAEQSLNDFEDQQECDIFKAKLDLPTSAVSKSVSELLIPSLDEETHQLLGADAHLNIKQVFMDQLKYGQNRQIRTVFDAAEVPALKETMRRTNSPLLRLNDSFNELVQLKRKTKLQIVGWVIQLYDLLFCKSKDSGIGEFKVYSDYSVFFREHDGSVQQIYNKYKAQIQNIKSSLMTFTVSKSGAKEKWDVKWLRGDVHAFDVKLSHEAHQVRI